MASSSFTPTSTSPLQPGREGRGGHQYGLPRLTFFSQASVELQRRLPERALGSTVSPDNRRQAPVARYPSLAGSIHLRLPSVRSCKS